MMALLPKPNHLLLAFLFLCFFVSNISGSGQVKSFKSDQDRRMDHRSIISEVTHENSQLREQRTVMGFGWFLSLFGGSGIMIIFYKKTHSKKKEYLAQLQQLEQELNFRKQEATSLAMQLTRTKQVMKQLNASLKKARKGELKEAQLNVALHHVGQELKKGKEVTELTDMLQNIHQDFYTKLSTQCPDLTSNELKMLGLVRMGLSTKEIASLKNISPKAIEMSRYRVRKKLNLTQNNHLSEYLMQLS